MSRTRCGETHGYHKQGVDYGYSKVKGLNALLAIVSTPVAAPVIAATRWRTGSTNSARGASRLVTDALVTAGRAGATGMVTVRCDSAYYNHDVVAAARRGGAHFSVTARADPAVRKAIASIGEDAWMAIKYPEAIWDEDEGRWISDAEVAEVGFTAFTSRRKAEHVTARLIVRRVRRLNPASVPAGQSFHCLDSSQAVRDVVAKYDVRHVIIGTGFIIPSMKRAPGLTALSQSRSLRL